MASAVIPVVPGQLLADARFQALSAVPAALEWFANIDNARGADKTGGLPYEGAAGACNHARRAPGGYHRLKLRMS